MKQTIAMKGLMSSLSVGVAMPQLFDIIIPKEIWESAATGTGYYNGYKVLLQEANIQHHLADEQFYVLKTRDTFDRQAWLFRCAAGSGVAFERYRGGESGLIVSNCDGIASHIFGGKAFDALSHSYLNALGEYQRTDTDVRISAAHRYAAQQIIKTLREGKDDKVLWPSNQALRRLMSLCLSVRNAQWLPAAAVVNDYYAAMRCDHETESDWELVMEYLDIAPSQYPAVRKVLELVRPEINHDEYHYEDVVYLQALACA